MGNLVLNCQALVIKNEDFINLQLQKNNWKFLFLTNFVKT